jgi:hypothetical protein
MVDWIAFLLLLVLYLAFAAAPFVRRLRVFVTCRRNGIFLAFALLLPFALLRLSDARVDMARFLNDLGALALYVAIPVLAVLLRPAAARALHWLDIVAILAFWLPIEFDLLPEAEIVLAAGVTLPATLLTAINLAFLTYLVLRPLPVIGYSFRLGRSDVRIAATALLAYMPAALLIGSLSGFLIFGVADWRLGEWLSRWPLIFLFNALPEELLFRGIIQQQIHARVSSDWLALGAAALIFGLSHANNPTPGFPEPNWMYVIMATLAGLAYGYAWRRSGKITTAALVHATVNFIWGAFLG